MNNFWQRLFTGAVFTGTLVAAIILSGWYLHITLGILAVLTLQEFYKLFDKSAYSPDPILGPLLGLGIYAMYILDLRVMMVGKFPHEYYVYALIMLFPIIAISELYRKKKTPFQNIGLSVLGMVYVLVPLILLNRLSLDWDAKSGVYDPHQVWPILAIFLIVWSNDTFAYLVGKQWGKTKLFERISPKKSWEGFFGGLIFAIICGNIIGYFQDGAYIEYTTYALIISVLGTIGDLIESMLKRSLGVKDSGKILPGHGGLLDRLDAVLFAIPFIFIAHELIFN